MLFDDYLGPMNATGALICQLANSSATIPSTQGLRPHLSRFKKLDVMRIDDYLVSSSLKSSAVRARSILRKYSRHRGS
jgi:hypothetical protein